MMNSGLILACVVSDKDFKEHFKLLEPITSNKDENKRKNENDSFIPLEFRMNGGMTTETKSYYRQLSQLLWLFSKNSDLESTVTLVLSDIAFKFESRKLECHRINKSNNGSKKTMINFINSKYFKKALLKTKQLEKFNLWKH